MAHFISLVDPRFFIYIHIYRHTYILCCIYDLVVQVGLRRMKGTNKEENGNKREDRQLQGEMWSKYTIYLHEDVLMRPSTVHNNKYIPALKRISYVCFHNYLDRTGKWLTLFDQLVKGHDLSTSLLGDFVIV